MNIKLQVHVSTFFPPPPILIEPIDLTRMSIIWQNRKVKK